MSLPEKYSNRTGRAEERTIKKWDRVRGNMYKYRRLGSGEKFPLKVV